MRNSMVSVALATVLSFTSAVQAKAVFAHYMVSTITQAHAQTDIDNAVAMGLDGFSLNIGDPTPQFVTTTLTYLFDYAATKGFKLFVSMDLYALDVAGRTVNDYYGILSGFLGASAWYKGPNGWPFLSTFSDGGLTNTQWAAFKQTYANDLYFVPDFDSTAGYYTADPGWWSYWGGIVDGVFSWESAWPQVGATNAGDISLDQAVIAGTSSHGKTYMMPLSTLQYKNSYNTNLFRQGGLNLPNRMANILGMSTKPDFVEVITWNDGPESHYIGNIWPESNTNPAAEKYATQASWPHNAWQPLIASFIRAYKSGGSASFMTPSSGTAAGAIWYKDILQSSVCSSDTKPAGFSTGSDSVNWAVVIANGATGYRVRIISNGVVLQTVAVYPGLNSGSPGTIQPGAQVMQLLNSAGNVVLNAQGGKYVSSGCPDGIYNMNYQVVGLA